MPSTTYEGGSTKAPDEAIIGSPLKKQRASLSGIDEESLRSKFGLGLLGGQGDVLGRIEQDQREEGQGVGLGSASQDQPLFGNSLDSISQEKVTFGGPATATQAGQPPVKSEEMEDEDL